MARRRRKILGIWGITKGETLQKVVHFGVQNLGLRSWGQETPPLFCRDFFNKGGGFLRPYPLMCHDFTNAKGKGK